MLHCAVRQLQKVIADQSFMKHVIEKYKCMNIYFSYLLEKQNKKIPAH